MQMVGLTYDPSAPIDAEAVIKEHYRTVVRMAASFGLEDPEGAAQEFFTRMLKNGHLDKYDATKGRSLRTYVLEMFRLRRQDFKRDQVRRTEHEITVSIGFTASARDGRDREGHETRGFAPGDLDPDLDTVETLTVMDHVVAGLPQGKGKIDPQRLAREMAYRATHGGDLTDRSLARHYGVSLQRLRDVKAELATDEMLTCLVA